MFSIMSRMMLNIISRITIQDECVDYVAHVLEGKTVLAVMTMRRMRLRVRMRMMMLMRTPRKMMVGTMMMTMRTMMMMMLMRTMMMRMLMRKEENEENESSGKNLAIPT